MNIFSNHYPCWNEPISIVYALLSDNHLYSTSSSDGRLWDQVDSLPRKWPPRQPRGIRGPRPPILRKMPRVRTTLGVAQSPKACPSLKLLLVRYADIEQSAPVKWRKEFIDTAKRVVDFLVWRQARRFVEKIGVLPAQRSPGHFRHLGKCLAVWSQDSVVQGSQ